MTVGVTTLRTGSVTREYVQTVHPGVGCKEGYLAVEEQQLLQG